MKKLLSLISTVSISVSAATTVVACDTKNTNNETDKPIDENSKQEMTLENIKKWAEDNKTIDYTGPGVFLTNEDDAEQIVKSNERGQSNFWESGYRNTDFALVQFIQKVIGDKLKNTFNQNLFNRFNFWFNATGFHDIRIKGPGMENNPFLGEQIIQKNKEYKITASFALIDRITFENNINELDDYRERNMLRKSPRLIDINPNSTDEKKINTFKFKINYTQTNDFTWDFNKNIDNEILSNLVKTKLNLTTNKKINQNIWKEDNNEDLTLFREYSDILKKVENNTDLETNLHQLIKIISDGRYIYGFNANILSDIKLSNIKLTKIDEVNKPYEYFVYIGNQGEVKEEFKYKHTAKGEVIRINLDIDNIKLVDLNGTEKTINLKDCVIEIFREDKNTV